MPPAAPFTKKRLAGLHADLRKNSRRGLDDNGESAGFFKRQVVGFPSPVCQDRVFCHRISTIAEDGFSDCRAAYAVADFIYNAGRLDADT